MATKNMVNQGDGGNKFETAQEIEINKNIVKFGTSVYQFSNVTGFEVGVIPVKRSWLISIILFSILAYLAFFTFIMTFVSNQIPPLIGIIILCLIAFLLISYFNQSPNYGLTIYLNSGQKRVFISRDRDFLMAIVENLYMFMKKEEAKSLLIDMSNRSITVGGSIGGSATAGDRNWM